MLTRVQRGEVAPFTGAWIEIGLEDGERGAILVAPFTGAWIEIFYGVRIDYCQESLPSRERGLK